MKCIVVYQTMIKGKIWKAGTIFPNADYPEIDTDILNKINAGIIAKIEDDVVVAKTDKEEVVLHEKEIQEAKNDEVEYVDPTIKQRYHSKHKKK